MATIVIVDDNDELRELAAEVLREEGYVVEEANDGFSGLGAISRIVPDLIISDISMPGLDGLSLRRRLNDLPGLSEIPFLFISAHQERETMRQGMLLGADDYLTKPFQVEELLMAVKTRLDRRGEAVDRERQRLARISESLQLIFPHEISTPLSQLMVAATLLRHVDPAEMTDYIDMIEQAAERLNRLTTAFRDVTTLSMREADGSYGFPVRQSDAVDVGWMIKNWVREVEEDVGATGRTHCSVTTLKTDIIPVFLQRIVIELVRNALQYSEGKVVLSVNQDGSDIVLNVLDEGSGFDAVQLAQPTPFVQLDRSTQEQQGLGLGLFLARRIVDILSGTLHISRRLAGGMDIGVRIPATGKR